MLVTDKGQITIPKHIRVAAGVAPGTEETFSLEGSRIVLTPAATGVKDNRRFKLRAAAAKVRRSPSPEFQQLRADEVRTRCAAPCHGLARLWQRRHSRFIAVGVV